MHAYKLGLLIPSVHVGGVPATLPSGNCQHIIHRSCCVHHRKVAPSGVAKNAHRIRFLNAHRPLSHPRSTALQALLLARPASRSLFQTSALSTKLLASNPPRLLPSLILSRAFHVSRPSRVPIPLFLWLAGFLKSSVALNAVSVFGRFALSLFPLAWVRQKMANNILRMAIKHPDIAAQQPFVSKLDMVRRSIVPMRYLVWTLGLAPFILIVIACVASLEQTPVTGRWRVIMLSPEEEERVSRDLSGYGWFTSVVQQVTQGADGKMPSAVPVTDWRWSWVEQTLRKLEAGIAVMPAKHGEPLSHAAEQYYSQPHEGPVPPPPVYPILPRPRLSQVVHALPPTVDPDDPLPHEKAQHEEHHSHHVAPHALLGPPYQVLLLDKPERNAFSHGYGPNGAGGIVVYTGFLDEILNDGSKAAPASNQAGASWWSSLIGAQPTPTTPRPTAEQTEALAVVLAHELSHLVLCHHLENLSSSVIVVPTLIGMFGDIGRTLLFPFTMLFGPFLNDAVANMFQVGHREMQKTSADCATRHIEMEADVVSIRLLAYAGYDPRSAVKFWESRKGSNDLSCSDSATIEFSQKTNMRGGSHPLSEDRLSALKLELARWEKGGTGASFKDMVLDSWPVRRLT